MWVLCKNNAILYKELEWVLVLTGGPGANVLEPLDDCERSRLGKPVEQEAGW